jgi:hypothetical protein
VITVNTIDIDSSIQKYFRDLGVSTESCNLEQTIASSVLRCKSRRLKHILIFQLAHVKSGLLIVTM